MADINSAKAKASIKEVVKGSSSDAQWCHDIGDTASSVGGGRASGGRAFFSGSSAASGIVAQYRLSTCLRAGRRIGFGRKKSMPESMHSLTLLSSAKAVRATIGAE